jgi:hypothetical protein
MDAPARPDPGQVLSAGSLPVAVMEVVGPPRLNELSGRIAAALRSDPSWWNEVVGRTPAGQPLPYDPRMGVSRAEYDEFLMLGDQRTLQKRSDAIVQVIERNNGALELDGGDALRDLTGVVIDLKNDRVQTPFGVATERTTLNPSKSVFGAWNGVQWSLRAPGTSVKFAVGVLRPSDRGILFYEVKAQKTNGLMQDLVRITHVLTFPLRGNGDLPMAPE